jgi:hypothetical protein
MSADTIFEGGCLCGDIRYRAKTEPEFVTHCHCQRCRRHSGALFATDVGFRLPGFGWEKGAPTYYQSSEVLQRGFCGRCGSTISARYLEDMDLIVIPAGTLDHVERVMPQYHTMTESQVPWLKIDDGLPRYKRFSPDDMTEVPEL